ncbi:uncharacterized protein LOC143255495 isoform X2 [Tachypleus tridentatus]|uniref:uncharacterized protein LOC143255495 isoform X2 n=1 Tax=Tachypleus tridentatus TaxID=6853 RepID=UPI003FD2AF31
MMSSECESSDVSDTNIRLKEAIDPNFSPLTCLESEDQKQNRNAKNKVFNFKKEFSAVCSTLKEKPRKLNWKEDNDLTNQGIYLFSDSNTVLRDVEETTNNTSFPQAPKRSLPSSDSEEEIVRLQAVAVTSSWVAKQGKILHNTGEEEMHSKEGFHSRSSVLSRKERTAVKQKYNSLLPPKRKRNKSKSLQ